MEKECAKMRVQKIENTKKNNDYLLAGAFGVVSGYALKHALPLSNYEHNSTYTENAVKHIKDAVSGARRNEFYAISDGVREGTENVAADVFDLFVKNKSNILSDDFDALKANTKTLSKKTQDGLFALTKRVHNRGKHAEDLAKRSLEALTKASRPSLYFIALTSAIALSLVVLKNSLKANMAPPDTNNNSTFDIEI